MDEPATEAIAPRYFFDGAVVHVPPVPGASGWTDNWYGPGGRLVVKQLFRPYPRTGLKLDFLETLYRRDGTIIRYGGFEGAEYRALPELMGEYWESYKEGLGA